VLLPAALKFQKENFNQDIVALLHADLELTEEQIAVELKKKGVEFKDLAGEYLPARRFAMRQRVEEAMQDRNYSLAQLRRMLLPRIDPSLSNAPLLTLLQSQYDKVQATRALWRFMRPMEPNLPPLLKAQIDLPPILQLSKAAVSGGFVDYVPFGDGVVRTVPLWVDVNGDMYPQMGLALACMMLGTDPGQLQFESDEVIIPLAGGAKRIPVRTIKTARSEIAGMLMDVPWWGTSDWTTMYDHPNHQTARQHASITLVWDICDMRRRIARNNASIDKALEVVLNYVNPDAFQAYAASTPPLHDTAVRIGTVQQALRELADAQYVELLESSENRTDEEQRNLDVLKNARTTLQENPSRNEELHQQVNRSRAELAERLRGRAVLIGWIATGSADVVPTSLHARCPGVVVHGAIFNAVMTDNYWRSAPYWVTLLTTLGIGLLTTLAVGLLTPSRAIIAAMLLTAGYLAMNGFALFDYGNLVVGVAGPIVAIGVVWSGCTLMRLLDEAIQRERIKRRFEHYVDPKLVSYLMEDPSRMRLEGEVREMTVVFTDLAGFTTLSERLKERTVELLNEFLGVMVPVIRDMHQGYLNKFLGDGIMFFYGAPRTQPRHASSAVATVLDMLKVMEEFNQKLAVRGLPSLSLRAGVSTGDMVVGDAGSADAHDYTVLGDCVNFGARLESANKALGTSVLLSQRTVELIGDEFLVRPVGCIQVVGKTEGVLTYEVLNRSKDATPPQMRLAEISRRAVDAFLARKFDECLASIDEMQREFGESKFVSLYRELAENYLRHPPGDEFDGKVILTEK